MIYEDGVEMDENGRAKICPLCGNEQFSKDAEFCRICGFAVYNLCEGITICDDYGNYRGEEKHINEGNARFCEKCGQPTHFFKAKVLKPYEEVREMFTQEYLKTHSFSIRSEKTLDTKSDLVTNNQDDSEEELPF